MVEYVRLFTLKILVFQLFYFINIHKLCNIFKSSCLAGRKKLVKFKRSTDNFHSAECQDTGDLLALPSQARS